ncbi:MAG: hypothetical protein LC768_12665 [Acidobacteria bacterium]|nr:hypothetical protein [Acidobacteriota bacterium]MCA1639164.1 hypothetical protein [Acidobacteriota bacterium]
MAMTKFESDFALCGIIVIGSMVLCVYLFVFKSQKNSDEKVNLLTSSLTDKKDNKKE